MSCEYCKRQKYIDEQVPFSGFGTNDVLDSVISNIATDGWCALIKPYTKTVPQLVVTDGNYAVYTPIKYCPFCGDKLFNEDKSEECGDYYS